jgi:hypothetical protein
MRGKVRSTFIEVLLPRLAVCQGIGAHVPGVAKWLPGPHRPVQRPDAARSGGGDLREWVAEASDQDVRDGITDEGTGEIRA